VQIRAVAVALNIFGFLKLAVNKNEKAQKFFLIYFRVLSCLFVTKSFENAFAQKVFAQVFYRVLKSLGGIARRKI
jgi:hypothetical protein